MNETTKAISKYKYDRIKQLGEYVFTVKSNIQRAKQDEMKHWLSTCHKIVTNITVAINYRGYHYYQYKGRYYREKGEVKGLSMDDLEKGCIVKRQLQIAFIAGASQ